MSSKYFQAIGFALLFATAPMNAPAGPVVGATGALVKPPLVEDPRKPVIQNLVRSTYPELFTPTTAPGWVAITLLMNHDGTLFKGYKDEVQAQPYITKTLRAFGAMGANSEKYGDIVQLDMRGGACQ